MEANRKGFKGVWLCAAIYESQELSAVEKLLLAEIDALTSDTDACYATNAHFSGHLGITVTRVDHLLGKLPRGLDTSSGCLSTEGLPGGSWLLSTAPIPVTRSHSLTVRNERTGLLKMTELLCRKSQSSLAEKSRAALRKQQGYIYRENTRTNSHSKNGDDNISRIG